MLFFPENRMILLRRQKELKMVEKISKAGLNLNVQMKTVQK